MTQTPTLLWLRRDLRLSDHPALNAAIARGGPVIPVFILDPETESLGAAAKFRLGLSIAAMEQALEAQGARLILRRGAAKAVLQSLCAETGADAVYWSRAYDPRAQARDAEVKAALKADGHDASSFTGHLLFEPWSVANKQGGYYKVYTPFWKAVKDIDPGQCLPAPASMPSPDIWPASEQLSDWHMGAAMRRGADVVATHCVVGEQGARDRLDGFLVRAVDSYKSLRDFPSKPATSGLSENLTYGEISPRQVWWAGQRALHEGAAGAEHFLKELVWREFAYHLLHYNQQLDQLCFRPEWEDFPWHKDSTHPDFIAWTMGQTGIDFVDAGMRELWVTGTMHNRVRMIAASYLTKHLMMDWRLGMAWFADQLIDWDPAANAMGWQWVAGCGPDAAPYFRIFNPDGQADKFDKNGIYCREFLSPKSPFFDAIPASLPTPHRPLNPIVDLAGGRKRALQAYEDRKG